MYVLWVGKEPIKIMSYSYLYVAKTLHEAKEIMNKYGFPLIASFGDGTIKIAKFIKENEEHLPNGFTYRIHGEKSKKRIKRIMTPGG